MNLHGLETFAVAPSAPGWGGRYWLFVRLVPDQGVTGYGECHAASVGPRAMEAVIEDVFTRHMNGEDSHNVGLMFRRAYFSGFTQRSDLAVMGAFSGPEIACWDILGNAHDRPVHALLGGLMNERIRSYSHLYPLPHHDPDEFCVSPEMAAEAAAAMLEQGFTAVKFDPAGPYTIRGGHMPAMADIGGSVDSAGPSARSPATARTCCSGPTGSSRPPGPFALARRSSHSTPCDSRNPSRTTTWQRRRRSRATSIPVAAGERLTTKAEFAPRLHAGAAAILQPALGRCGGILEAKEIATVAQPANAQLEPHVYAGLVEWAAIIQFAANIPKLLVVETISTGGNLRHGLIGDAIWPEDGFVQAVDAPGLEIAFDEERAPAHPYIGTGLHLEMQEAPCKYSEPNVFWGGALAKDD